MSFSSELKEELLELKMWDSNSSLKQDEQLARLCVREAFIKSGFVNSPDKEYHLEILFKTNKKAEAKYYLEEAIDLYKLHTDNEEKINQLQEMLEN